MIAHLRGRLLEKHPNRVIVDVNGVGYDVHVPLSTFYEMAEPGEEIALRIHTHVREDALLLYGFATRARAADLRAADQRQRHRSEARARGALGHRAERAGRRRFGTANVARLTGIPGIGKKTAERIGLELKDKMATFLPAETAASPPTAAGETLRTDVLSALMNLGYHRPLAERAVDAALKKSAGSSFETILKHALRELVASIGTQDHVLHLVRCMKVRNFSCSDSGHSRRFRRALRRAVVAHTTPPPAATSSPSSGRRPTISRRAISSTVPAAPTLAPQADDAFTWVATDTTGYSPGFDVRGSDGRTWSVKLGPEAQTEVVASRVLWAIGYHQPPTYYVSSWQLSGGPGRPTAGGAIPHRLDGRRSRRRLVVVRKRVRRHAAISRADRRQHSAEQLGLEDVQQQDLSARATARSAIVVRDLGASLGKTSASRLLWIFRFPMRGFGQGSRNNIDDFESQGFIKRVDENEVEFDFDTIYGSVVDLVRPADVRWTAELLSRLTDAQWDDAFRAADYSPDVRARYIKKIKAKIAEGLAVS